MGSPLEGSGVCNEGAALRVKVLHCSWRVFWFFSFLVLFIFTGGLQKPQFLATIPRLEMGRLF